MAKITRENISDRAVDASKIILLNDQPLNARNFLDSADIAMFKINASNEFEFLLQPKWGTAPVANDDLANKEYIDTGLALKLNAAEKGAANGVAPLDAGGKVPVSFLPNSIVEYKGVWNASTNTPALADGAGNADTSIGDVYRVSVAGSQDLGSGSISFVAGDYVILNENKVWEKSANTDSVTSVNGLVGVVVLTTDEIAEGSSNLYYTQARFDAALAAKSSDDLSEGSANLYFTDARAKAATVSDSAYSDVGWDSVTDVAPSKNAVRDEIESLKTLIDSNVGALPGAERLVLSGGDITAGFIDLAQEALNGAVQVVPVGGITQDPGVDFTVSVVGGVTRITFAGDLLTILSAGSVLNCFYTYEN